MKDFIRHAAILALAGLVLAATVAFTGVFNVSARLGHLPGADWFLHTVYENSVELWSTGLPDPPLDDPALVELGAAHFDTGCRPCHGAPGRPQSPVARSMVPLPPPIDHAVRPWDAHELFWIVREGVKFSGMPHWPAKHRDDEVWAVVAFLRQVPTMDAARYRHLAFGPAVPPRVAGCARCHGADGRGRTRGRVPRLDGLGAPYIAATLAAYADGRRESGIMHTQAVGLGRADITALARAYGGSAAAGLVLPPGDASRIARGRAIALGQTRVPACVACHGPGRLPRNTLYPPLAGQPAGWLDGQLHLFKAGMRGGTRFAPLMVKVARQMDDGQMADAAAYYASLDRGRADLEDAPGVR